MMKYTSTRSKFSIKSVMYLLVLLIIIIGSIVISPPGGGVNWPPPKTIHESSISPLWTISTIFIKNSSQPALVLDDTLIILGNNDYSQRNSNIIAINANNGKTAWVVDYDGIAVAARGPNLFIGGIGEVISLDSSNGGIIWRTHIQTNVTRISVEDNLIYIDGTASYYYILDAANGTILNKIDGSFLDANDVILGNKIYRKTSDGDVVAYNQGGAQLIWRSKAQAVSNLTTTQSFVFALSETGDVLKFNPITGLTESLLKFVPSPLPLYSGEDSGFEYLYYIFGNPQGNILFIYLGDSAQLFAFRLLQ